jgi:hypothetical protein
MKLSSSALRHQVQLSSIAASFVSLIVYAAVVVVNAQCDPSNKPFRNREELKAAIDTCFEGNDQATSTTISDYDPDKCDGDVKNKYGWPMNTWCVGEVDDFQALFKGKMDFNEEISGK